MLPAVPLPFPAFGAALCRRDGGGLGVSFHVTDVLAPAQ